MSDPFAVVRQFEAALCEYTGAKYAVTTTSCTMALLLACAWHISLSDFEIPRFTYVGVPQSILNAGGVVKFRNEAWLGWYQLKPYPIWDSARWLHADMYVRGLFQCVSFHTSKHLGLAGHGGAILHDNDAADEWLRRARFDGRAQGVAPKDDLGIIRGWHCYMTPATAAEGLMRLALLPRNNEPLPNSEYPDLSQLEIFR